MEEEGHKHLNERPYIIWNTYLYEFQQKFEIAMWYASVSCTIICISTQKTFTTSVVYYHYS